MTSAQLKREEWPIAISRNERAASRWIALPQTDKSALGPTRDIRTVHEHGMGWKIAPPERNDRHAAVVIAVARDLDRDFMPNVERGSGMNPLEAK
jgi:hypothetical protein